MQLKTDEQGNVVLAPGELEKILKMQAEETAKAVAANTPPEGLTPQPNASSAEDKYAEKPHETNAQKMKRLLSAAADIKLGKLGYQRAPKEIKTIAFFRAIGEKTNPELVAAIQDEWAGESRKSILVSNTGGYLIPIEFATDIKVAIEEYSAIADCTQHDLVTNDKELRGVSAKPVIYQVNEQVAPQEAVTTFKKPILSSKAFAGLQVISKEEFQDNNVGLYQRLVQLFAEAFAARKSKELFKGQTFTGIYGAANTVVTRTATTSITSLTYNNLVTLVNSLTAGMLAGGGKFYMHRTIWGIICGLVDSNGRPIVNNPWDPRTRTLFGYPVVLDEQSYSLAENAADRGFIVFGNLQWVDHGVRQEMTTTLLTEATVVAQEGSINLAAQRSYGLLIDTRWGLVVSMPEYLAVLKTAIS